MAAFSQNYSISRQHLCTVLAVCACLLAPLSAAALEPGRPAPAFAVNYGDSELRLSELAGSVIVIACESRNSIDINQPFKDMLLETFPADKRLRNNIVIVPVISCFDYLWPIRALCARRVQDSARKLDVQQLYVDLTGDMFRDYGAVSGSSTAIIVDREGIVRYVHAGAIPDEDISAVIELIRSLAGLQESGVREEVLKDSRSTKH